MLDTLIRGNHYYQHDSWNHDELRKYSKQLLNKTIKNAYNKSKFYREYYSSFGIKPEDMDNISIDNLPYMDKDTVRDNFYGIATDRINPEYIKRAELKESLISKAGKYFLVHTSGSTGKPCKFLYDRRALDIIVSNFVRISIRGENHLGFHDFPIKTIYCAPVGSGYACTALALNGIKKFNSQNVVVNAAEPLEIWKEKIGSFTPNYLGGYPSCIKILSRLQEKGEINIRPKKIITGGEPLTHETIKYFHDLFGSDVIDYYGCTESILIGAGSSCYEGLYLFDDMNYTEVDENGRLVITTLYNSIFPLIRYRLNDIVEGFSRKPYGSLPYTHIDRVVGRNEELMWFKNENGKMDFLHPLFIDDLDVDGIKEYQFIQSGDDTFILRCVKMPYASPNVEKSIKLQMDKFLHKKKMPNIKYKLEFADKLEADSKTGKVKMVIKNN